MEGQMLVFARVSHSPLCITSKLNESAWMCLAGWTAPFLEELILEIEGLNFKISLNRCSCKEQIYCSFSPSRAASTWCSVQILCPVWKLAAPLPFLTQQRKWPRPCLHTPSKIGAHSRPLLMLLVWCVLS